MYNVFYRNAMKTFFLTLTRMLTLKRYSFVNIELSFHYALFSQNLLLHLLFAFFIFSRQEILQVSCVWDEIKLCNKVLAWEKGKQRYGWKIHHLEDQQTEKVVKSDKVPRVVDFFARCCVFIRQKIKSFEVNARRNNLLSFFFCIFFLWLK